MSSSGSQHDHLDSLADSLSSSFRKFTSGIVQNGFHISPDQSLEDGSFRKSNSVISTNSRSSSSVSANFGHSSRRKVLKGIKDYGRRIVDLDVFVQNVEEWIVGKLGEEYFASPFTMDELRKLDVALEGTLFQQLFRMPRPPNVSADDLKQDQYVVVEDFFRGVLSGLWRTFWHKRRPPPFVLSCPRRPGGSKFYSVEKAISKGKLDELCGFALTSTVGSESDPRARWEQVAEFVLFKENILSGNELKLCGRVLCEALFYGFHVLVSRYLRKTSDMESNYVFILVLDSRCGGVVRLGGDVGALELNSVNPYQSVAEWIKNYAEIRISTADLVWNRLGNPNWRDVGALQLVLATLYSIAQWNGPPRKSIASLASDHSFRLQKRWMEMECRLADGENTFVPTQHSEIIEADHHNSSVTGKKSWRLKLSRGETLRIDDHRHGERIFQIQEPVVGGNHHLYTAILLDHPNKLLALYVGAHPSRLEPSWEDMSLWYQVQRQTKVLNILSQGGNRNKHLPEMVASGRILHSGPCEKPSLGGLCDHPCCGTPVLATSPVGEPLSSVVAREGRFSPEEAVRCCRDCLAALSEASTVGVQHGDISPENVVCVAAGRSEVTYFPTSWGRAVVEASRDSPGINLQFSSAHALQHGKLCPSSDAESLAYLLLFVCGGSVGRQDSIESALAWRERLWAERTVQKQLGAVSATLKAFADYVDTLCGTPYPVDYGIWLSRLSAAVAGGSSATGKGKVAEDVAESSGTSGGCTY